MQPQMQQGTTIRVGFSFLQSTDQLPKCQLKMTLGLAGRESGVGG